MYSKIAFDIDGIVLDTAPWIIYKYNEIYGTNLIVENWNAYSFEESFGEPKEQVNLAFDELVKSTEIPFMNGAIRSLKAIREKVQEPLVFVTTRGDWQAEIAKEQIERAIGSSIFVYSERINKIKPKKMSRLQELNVKFFVEDNATHWRDFIATGIYIGTLILPWTQTPLNDAEDLLNTSLFPFLHWDHLESFLINLIDII
jgi:hypothetical protein